MLFYLIFIGIDLLLLPSLVKYGRALTKQWQRNESGGLNALLLFGFCLLACSAIIWLFIVFWTISSLITSLNPSAPEPYFFFVWLISLIAYAAPMAFTEIMVRYFAMRDTHAADKQANSADRHNDA